MRKKLEFKILGIGLAILVMGIITASVVVVYVQKSTVYGLAEERLGTVAELITKDIDRTMLEASAERTLALMAEYRSVQGIEGIEVFNWEGKEAFKPGAPAVEAAVLGELMRSKAPITVAGDRSLTFYRPLENRQECWGCHGSQLPIVGAVKISISLAKEYGRTVKFVLFVTVGSLFGVAVLGAVFWQILRRSVIRPIKTLESASKKMADGDLSFKTEIKTQDEIGELDRSIKASLYSLSRIIQRVRDISRRISSAADTVERDSDKVVGETQTESEAVMNISSSVEQMNAAISEIAESTDGLAASVEETAASIEEMTSSIDSVAVVTNELSSGVDSASSSIEELSATLKEVAENAGELAEVSDETLSAVEEIISSIKEVELGAKESAKISQKATDEASTLGMNSINKTIEGMQRIKVAVESTADAMKKLGKRSEEIGKILNVINEVTDQTTLLSLNAAILAARAGEHGRGFSVVADEIKDLAERTTFSTQEIASLIQTVRQEVQEAINLMKEGLKSVEEGITLSGETGRSFKKILESTKKSSEMAFAIESATAEQSKAARLVTESVERVRAMVGQIAKATSEQSKGISLIIGSTERMRDASFQVASATNEQATSSKQISQAIEMVSEKTQQISHALNEQKSGSNQIFRSIESIKNIPKENRDIAFNINKTLRELMKDAEFLVTEVERFALYEGKDVSVVKFGVVPLESPADMFRRFTPLMNYLSRKLDVKFDMMVASDFEAAVREIGEGVTQLCFMTPSTYIDAHRKYGVELMVKALREGKPYQHSVIVVKEESPIKSVKDLRNRSFAFGDMNSTSSHIVPRSMLLAEGIDIRDLSYYNYLGHHDDVARAVLRGDFDAGGIMEATAYKYKEKGLRFLKFSEEIPEFNICVKSIDGDLASKTKAALLELGESTAEGNAVLKAMNKEYTGFTEAVDEDYNNVRLMMSRMGML